MDGELTLRAHYWDDAKALAAFMDFIRKIHSIDFSSWESSGYWDDAYTPFSFFEGDSIVSSVCIYMLDAIVDGESRRLAQLSGVGTLENRRRKGFSRRLTEFGLEWAEGKHDGVFLFADAGAVPFYHRCGFTPMIEHVETVAAPSIAQRPGIVKLDPGRPRDLDKIYEYAERRTPISHRFSVMNPKLVVFHALHRLRDHAYEIPDLETIIFFERSLGRLTVFDIVGERVPQLAEFYPYIADAGDKVIGFHFHADKLGLDDSKVVPLFGNNPFVKGAFPVDDPVFPFTSKA